MARTKTKSGSKEMVTCPVCGLVYTKAGMIGHLRFKHGRDHKAPMIPITRPGGEKAYWNKVAATLPPYEGSIHELYKKLRSVADQDKAKPHAALLSDLEPVVNAYLADHDITAEELGRQLDREKRLRKWMLDTLLPLMKQSKAIKTARRQLAAEFK